MRPGFYTRKSWPCLRCKHTDMLGFNEAGILHPEKLSVWHCAHGPLQRFNEAGILHPEKRPCGGVSHASSAMLQ